MPTLHNHTHWQASQTNTQTKACQRVCLSHPEKKKIKTSFPSKNFKNAKTRTTRTPGHNSVYVAIAGKVVNRRSVLLKNFVLSG